MPIKGFKFFYYTAIQIKKKISKKSFFSINYKQDSDIC